MNFNVLIEKLGRRFLPEISEANKFTYNAAQSDFFPTTNRGNSRPLFKYRRIPYLHRGYSSWSRINIFESMF